MATTSEATLLTDQHRRRQVALAVTADSQMRRTWDATLDPANLEATQPIWKRAMLDTLTKWWKVSADTAAQYLPRFRQAEIGDGGIEVGIPRFDRALAGRQLEWGGMVNVLWHVAMGQTMEAAYTAARELFLGMFHEAVLTGGRMTIQEWARRDSRAIGWRRVSDGDPCAFCAMLVSRGPVYTSEEHALTRQSDGQKFHPHCGCTVEVVYGDWKPSGREQQWVDDYYRAAESLPDKTPRTADTVLPIMRRSGHYRDSPKPPSPRPAGKPDKPHIVIEKLGKNSEGADVIKETKTVAAAGKSTDYSNGMVGDSGIIDATKASEHRAICRQILESGNAAHRYESLKSGEDRGYESWMKDQIRVETLKHDATWVRGGASPKINIEPGAHPMSKEMACAESLSSAGFKVTFRATRAASNMRTSDLFILENGKDVAWEMKRPTGNGRQTISHQFEEAAGQSDKLIIDATAFQQGSRWSDDEALARECEKLIRYHFKDSEGKAMRFSEVLIVENVDKSITIKRIVSV